jgi:hypothetical protein
MGRYVIANLVRGFSVMVCITSEARDTQQEAQQELRASRKTESAVSQLHALLLLLLLLLLSVTARGCCWQQALAEPSAAAAAHH